MIALRLLRSRPGFTCQHRSGPFDSALLFALLLFRALFDQASPRSAHGRARLGNSSRVRWDVS
jgi:hypothetical protein